VDVEAAGRVAVTVNGERAASLEPTGGGWGTRETVVLPDDLIRDDRANTVAFVREGRGPWAVRRVALSGPPLPLEDRAQHGAIPASDPGRRDRVTYTFEAAATPMTVTVRGFDVARGEVAVSLDGVTIAWLPATDPRAWGRPSRIVLQPGRMGTHRLTFDATGFGEDPWAVRLDAMAPAALA
jgi:hypothetical protein